MTVADLLAELRELDVHVVLDDDRLRLNAPSGVLTDDHKRDLANQKPEIIAFLREAQQLATQRPAIVPLQPAGGQTPIFAVAGHNGDVFAYRQLAHHLGADQPFFGLHPLGLEQGTEPLTRVEDIAGYFAQQIRAVRPKGAISIAGFCAGGTVAYELARELATTGADVTNLILFGAPFCTSYRSSQPIARARHFANTHARALMEDPASEARRVADRARSLLPRHDTPDPVLIRRAAVEEATMSAVRAYSPAPSSSHIDFMIPCESWKRSSDEPLRWSSFAGTSDVYVGPNGCNGDIMLKPQYAATFAAFVADAQQRHALAKGARREVG